MAAAKRKIRVLAIDDEPGLTRLLKLNLEGTGTYVVREENQGSRGAAAAREFKPDLILLDIIMPDISGGEVAEQLRADPALTNIPVIFLTALISREQAQSATQRGPYPYLAKPATPEELTATISKELLAATGGAMENAACLAKPFTIEELLACVRQRV